MKKLSKYFAFCAICLGSFIFCSCEKSNADLLKEYQKVAEEIVTAIKDDNTAKINKLSEKGEKLEKELDQRDLTESEKEEKAIIEAEIFSSLIDFEGA